MGVSYRISDSPYTTKIHTVIVDLPQSQGYQQFSSMGYGHAVTGSFLMVTGCDPSIGVTTI